MDFTLSLAHFCELHGPTSVLCTRVLPSCCALCRPYPSSSSSSQDSSPERTSYFPPQSKSWRSAGYVAKDMDRCASCRMTIPDDTFYDPSPAVDKNRPPMRTKEDIHICGDADSDSDDSPDHHNPFPSPSPSPNLYSHHASPCPSSSSCHTHSLEYVTAPSPAEIEMFSKLRTSILRAFTGEELPRGQQAGPFWFGSSVTGYTVGYKFVLADEFARGTRRTYALLALAGYDIQRALAAATVLWALFEQITSNIIRAAQEVSARSHPEEDSTPPGDETEDMMRRQAVSGFLSGRGPMGGLGRMMHDRRGAGVDQKPTSIAELVENERFFCELHMVFVSILQELGRTFGGMQVKAPDEGQLVDGELTDATVTTEDQQLKGKGDLNKPSTTSAWTESNHPYPPTPKSFESQSHSILSRSGMMTSREVAV